jgi:molybdopterin-guanine dinucleotide biosynthesis protein A
MDDAVASARSPSTADTGAGRACALVAVLAGELATRMGTAKASVDRLQPLPALYSPADLPKLERALECECSLQTALQTLAPCVIAEEALAAFGEPRRLCFSVNAPGDLQMARRWMER